MRRNSFSAQRGLVLAVLMLLSLTVGASCSKTDDSRLPSIVTPQTGHWQWQNPSPQGTDFSAIWASSASDVFVLGGGRIQHYDGSTWSRMSLPDGFEEGLLGIWGSSSCDVFVVGGRGAILRHDGVAWSLMDSGTTCSLNSIWGSSSENAFVVGDNGTILHYDGVSWVSMDSGTSAVLTSVWCSSADDAFAVGRALGTLDGVFLHYDGSVWSSVSFGSSTGLDRILFNSVWGRGPNDVYATGVDPYVNCMCVGAVAHFDGSAWSPMATGQDRGMSEITGSPDSRDLFGIVISGPGDGLMHYDGSSWHMEKPSTPSDITAICCVSSSEVFTAGRLGRVMRFDGGSWSNTLPASSVTDADLKAIWGAGSSDVFAVGADGTILHSDGSSWTAMVSGITDELRAVCGTDGEHVIALGGWATVIRYDGEEWQPVDTGGITGGLDDIWLSPDGDIFATGWYDCSIWHYDGHEWTAMNVPTTLGPGSVWGASPEDVFVVGYGGIILHYDGRDWTQMESGTTADLQDVYGTSPSDVYAVGQEGTILHYDGSSWRPMTSGVTYPLESIWATSSSDVTVGCFYGVMLHYDGASWSMVPMDTGSTIECVWGNSPTDVFAVGEGGIILHSGGAKQSTTEVTIGDILADPESYAGQRVLVSGQFHALGHVALAADWYWSAWGIGDGSDIMEVYLKSDECLIWSTLPDYEEDEEIRLPGVVSVELVGKGRFPSVCLLVNVADVHVQTRPLITDAEPETLVGELIGGTGEVVSIDRGKGRCVIETEDGVRLDFRLIELSEEYQVVGLHVRFAGIGCIAGGSPRDGMPIYLYYVEKLDG